MRGNPKAFAIAMAINRQPTVFDEVASDVAYASHMRVQIQSPHNSNGRPTKYQLCSGILGWAGLQLRCQDSCHDAAELRYINPDIL